MNSIHDICKQYGIENYTVNDDGSIDVNGNVKISFHKFTELPLTFNKVNGNFICYNNLLTTLKGCPRWVESDFNCDYNNLTSLELAPDYVGSWFSCEHNNLIDNLCDTEIGSNYFYTSLEQDGLIINSANIATNYNEWRKLYKRKLILNELYTRTM